MSVRRNGARIFALAMVAAVCFAPATAAASDKLDSPALDAVVTSDANVITPSTRRITGDIELTAGPQRIAVTVEATSPAFSSQMLTRFVTMGPTLRPMHMIALTPKPDYLFLGSGGSSGSSCTQGSDGPAFPRGGDSAGILERAVLLKPHETVKFSTKFDVAGDAPWFGTDYSPTYKLRRVSADVGDGTRLRPVGVRTLKKTITLRAPAPAVTGPFAARIDISALTAPSAGDSPAKISGNLVPGVEGRTISFVATKIPYDFSKPATPWPIGTATTGPNGAFSFESWSPMGKGGYFIYPSYESQPGDLLPSSSCPLYYSKRTGFRTGF